MNPELGMEQYLGLFLEEAAEQLEILERECLALEAGFDSERIQSVFRAAHTLKGSSRAMGFESIATLTHRLEDVLDAIRSGRLELTTDLVTTFLEAADTLKEMVAGISEGGDAKLDFNDVASRLEAALQAKSSNEMHSWTATITVQPDSQFKSIRAQMVVKAMQDAGGAIEGDFNPEDLDVPGTTNTFALDFQFAGNREELTKKLLSIGDVTHVQIKKARAKTEQPAEPLTEERKAGRRRTDAPEPQSTVRVPVSRLDELLNLAGELVVEKTRILETAGKLSAGDPKNGHIAALKQSAESASRAIGDLQDQVMKARLMPVETIFARMPRMVRDLAAKNGKSVELEVTGAETELDRSVIEAIGDPLIHILRNSVDHGIESPEERAAAGKPKTGTIRIQARHSENQVVIEITDDGRGIDHERLRDKAVSLGLVSPEAAAALSAQDCLQFIFSSGFSTASEVSEVSGRGVGMDIVRANIQKLGGMIDIQTQVGIGTVFTLRLPLTLAIIRGLNVRVHGVVYVLPLSTIVEILQVQDSDIQTVQRREMILSRGRTLPIIRLRNEFSSRQFSEEQSGESHYVVVVGLAEQKLGLMVDELIGEQEIVLKPLSSYCGRVPGIGGAAILGDGTVALVVDVSSIFSFERK